MKTLAAPHLSVPQAKLSILHSATGGEKRLTQFGKFTMPHGSIGIFYADNNFATSENGMTWNQYQYGLTMINLST